jgi:hypothetical protein
MTTAVPPALIPPLEDGQRLSREEFERRYDAMPGLKKAELIEGVVHVPPVCPGGLGQRRFALITWLGRYRASVPGVRGGAGCTIRLDLDNEPQPDACLLIDPKRGGQAHIDPDDYLSGAPELIAELSRSSIHRDLGNRMTAYQRNGVREYVVWRVEDGRIDWYVLREGQFVRLIPDAAGILRSEVFPGLWLDPAALIADNLPHALVVLQQGIASPEHAAFVARLNPPTP